MQTQMALFILLVNSTIRVKVPLNLNLLSNKILFHPIIIPPAEPNVGRKEKWSKRGPLIDLQMKKSITLSTFF